METVLWTSLGWLFGLVGVWLVDLNRAKRTLASTRKSLRFELVEYGNRMAGIVYIMMGHTGERSPELFDWLYGEFKSYEGLNRNEPAIEALELLRENPDIAPAVIANYSAEVSVQSVALKKYPTPALDQAVAMVAQFRPPEQQLILELRTLVANLDAVVDEAWRFFEKTYDTSLTQDQLQRINLNTTMAYKQVMNLCRRIAEHARELRKELDLGWIA